ncbi:helix-turn-helix transcriptional regulator [Gryllotalpicola koreensis]|uniref:HTH luxR-type domain-containing protein n=1 Tax=Gryllotalpicola koreensis TaxID=993086 RepID=A0ABP7ZPB3_9MICO
MTVHSESEATRPEFTPDAPPVIAPTPPVGSLPRPRLWELLDRPTRLTVVRAPTGFGKTVLLRQWAHRFGHDGERLIWLDGADADGRHRLAYDAAEDTVLVWDHFDEVADDGTEAALLAALTRNPHLRLIVAVRDGRRFPDVLRLEVPMATVATRELAFQGSEVHQIFELIGVRLDEHGFEQLERGVSGWPKPMHELATLLAARSGEAARLDEALIRITRRFLRDDVIPMLGALPDSSWPDFVLASAVPDHLTEELARAVTGDGRAGDRLEQLVAQTMMIASSEAGERTYRWRPTHRAALRQDFEKRDPAGLRRVHERASAWYFDHGRGAEALAHAHLAQDWPAVVRIVERYWTPLMYENYAETRTALREAPVSVVSGSIAAVAIRDIFMLRWRVGDDLLLEAARASRLSEPHWIETLPIPAWDQAITDATAVMIALRTRGELPLAQRFAESVDAALNSWLTIAGVPGLGLSGDALHAMLHAGITRTFADDHDGAVETLRRTYRFSPRTPGDPSAPNAAVKTALAYALVGETRQTEDWLGRSGGDDVEVWPLGAVRAQRTLAAALAAIERGDRDDAREQLGLLETRTPNEYVWETAYVYAQARFDLVWGDRQLRLRELARERERLQRWLEPGSTLGPLVDSAEAELHLALGNGTKAQALLAASDHPRLLVPRALLALLSGRSDEVVRITTAALSSPSLIARDQTQLQALKAVAQARLGEDQAAARTLADALASAAASGARLGLASAPRAELRELAVAHGLAERLDAATADLPEIFPGSVDVIVLTAREREVLGQLAAGRTVRQMADASFLSQNTIKSQLRTLYLKLGVSSRARALALAHEHRLLEDR